MKTIVLLFILSTLCACSKNPQERGYTVFNDMVHSPAYEAYSVNPVTLDGKTMMDPVKGSIARGKMPHAYGRSETESIRAGIELKDPYQETELSLKRGAYLYKSFCVSCHGETGGGDGPIIKKKFPAPPDLKSSRLKEFSKGRIYHVITAGFGDMPPHDAQMTIKDRWYLAQFVKQMQK